MASVTYAIVFSGQILDGHQIFSVKAHMSKMLKADADKMQALFSGKQVVLKRTSDKQQALKIGTALKKIGADVRIKAVKTAAPTASAAPSSPASTESTDSALSLAPMEGYIVEPKSAPPAPDINLANFSLGEMGDEPLAEPRPVEAPSIDVSNFSVSENDGSPLVEPSAEAAPRIDAPDFGLDEPGAVLETLKEDKKIVNPDISSLTLAEPGSDLVDESAHPPPPPRAPDVSGLSLAD